MTSELTTQQLDEIDTRAAHLFEYVTLPTEADQLAGVDVPALLAEVRRARAELDAEKSAHRFTLRQRNNRSTRLTHLRGLALAGDTEALLAAAKDTLAASRHDHDGCADVSSVV
jgi:hypothetical protein